MVERTKEKSEYEGRQAYVKEVKLPKLEVIENMFKDVEYKVALESSEVNSVCPKSGLPDFGSIRIEYIPNRVVIEEKSFKMYITAFRNIGIFKEFLTARLFKDFVAITKPKYAEISASFEPRGGIPSYITIIWDGTRFIGGDFGSCCE